MKPVAFETVRAASLAEASRLLREAGGGAKLVAGGQSLGPMLNLRLARPRLLIDVAGIAELTVAVDAADQVVLGSCVTTAAVEDGRAGDAIPMLAEVAGHVAYRAVRNRGTVGGSLCHADPAADWPTALAALGADVIISDGRTERSVPVAGFATGAFETALAPGEILVRIRVPVPSHSAAWGWVKLTRKAGEFALANAAVLVDHERGICRIAIGALRGPPLVVGDARGLFGGGPVGAGALDRVALNRLLGAHGGDGGTERALHVTALARAADRAAAVRSRT
ncbi:FAD binding domain-containing protein [Rhodoplanes sp. TEM]|uniref:FAD binding domain-containing protein n=1 Tax=Rhodoplanes tepidamans TaxID=200616 RepID=A0ABT5J511_RHOTP|nr:MULTISPECIES: FAD binding domain-containing protein [Rhodoplanes]MDC7784720.1 FAD binding domain-containing protein [Rhodoplanes tepidamans]MDC7982187.1 FAD binding domain-containing protein [Rhodoplanes sp. TEM]MDQ0356191.1 carbon-monoxide dehydrogenase medium subunit [Rhodoplanes tepidamans]